MFSISFAAALVVVACAKVESS